MKTYLFLLFLIAPPALAAPSIALIYEGPGSCDEDCTRSAVQVAKIAGFATKIVHPQDLNEKSSQADEEALFRNAKVWVQPGGGAHTAYEAMSPRLREAIVTFVRAGGGYVGFCAGAFLSTAKIGKLETPGFGFIPGKTETYRSSLKKKNHVFSIEPIKLKKGSRNIYFEDGPFFTGVEEKNGFEIMARYKTGEIAAVRGPFGTGHVYVIGPHPEAPLWWSKEDGIKDPDGSDRQLAVNMIRWVAGKLELSPSEIKNFDKRFPELPKPSPKNKKK